MNDSQFIEWIHNGFESLPRCKDSFFIKLWRNGKMYYGRHSMPLDSIDELSARLVCSNLHERRQILIILPDAEPKRPAALFATALIMSSVDSIQANREGGRVLYFGSTLGIRSQLSQISIGNLSLESVFSQTYGRGKTNTVIQKADHLPSVVCVYSPLDPVPLVAANFPRWVAIDCGNAPSIQWLCPLLEYLRKKSIPVIAWSSNPLSSIREGFISLGAHVFKWPSVMVKPNHLYTKNTDISNTLEMLTKSHTDSEITPCFVNGRDTEMLSNHLMEAQRALAEGMAKKPERLGQDALSIGWRYLRALERVPIPIDLFDSESIQYWGIRRIGGLRHAYEKFMSAISLAKSNISEKLEVAKSHLDIVHEAFRENDPPRWNLLIDLCLEDIPYGHARVLVFSSAAQKSMFAFSLLARTNTSQSDLADMRIWLLPFKDAAFELEKKVFRDAESNRRADSENCIGLVPPSNLVWDVIHVALPSQPLVNKMAPFLRLGNFEILIYPHQLPLLSRLVREWGDGLGTDYDSVVKALSTLACSNAPGILPERVPACSMCEARTVAGRTQPRKSRETVKPIWEPSSAVDEVAFLFAKEDVDSLEIDDDLVLEEESERPDSEPLVDWALEINFTDGWRGLFALDARLNMVRSTSKGDKVESCFARSLRKGDRIVYIYGQKRQSLYDLVLSRVHHDPSIEIHLALIRQWQDEIRQAYADWRQGGKTLDSLYREMLVKGTKLSIEASLRAWVEGNIFHPHDCEDMRRIAEILAMSFTQQHYKRVYKSGSRIHGLHIALSRRLNAWIQSGATAEMTDDLIDEATGLTFSDIRDSLILLRVESFSEVHGLFDKSRLNRIERR